MADLSEVLRQAPRECWLALTRDETRVVGRGENIEEAVAEAKENGEDDPVVLWLPRMDTGYLLALVWDWDCNL